MNFNLLTKVRRTLRKFRRRNALAIVGAFFALTFVTGWFVGVDPQTGNLTFTLGGENSFSGKTLNYTATAAGLPTIIGTPDQLAFQGSNETSDNDQVDRADDGNTSTSNLAPDNNVSTATGAIQENSDPITATTTNNTDTDDDQSSSTTLSTTNRNAQGTTTSSTSTRSTETRAGETTPTSTPELPPISNGRSPLNLDQLDFQLIDSDDFNGSSLNTDFWQPGLSHSGYTDALAYSETACYSDNQVQVRSGFLELSAQPVPNSDRSLCLNNGRRENGNKAQLDFVTGMIASRPEPEGTNSAFVVEQGDYLETRIEIPVTNGSARNWVEVYLHGRRNWHPGDVFSTFNNGGLLSPVTGLEEGACSQRIFKPGLADRKFTNCTDPGGFLTVGTLWKNNGDIEIYHDGVLFDTYAASVADGIRSSDLKLNVLIGYRIPMSNAPGYLAPTSKQTIRIDYIDHYKIVG